MGHSSWLNTGEDKKESNAKFQAYYVSFIPWDVIKLGLLIYLYLLGKYLFIYWGKCPWGKDRSGRSLGGCSDHRVNCDRMKFCKGACLQDWCKEGPSNSSHPSEENGFSQNWAYFTSFPLTVRSMGSVQRRWVNSECTPQAFHHLSPHHKKPEGHILVAATAGTWKGGKL